MMHMSNFGVRLRDERLRIGLNQESFGMVGGVRKQAQLKYEKGERKPDADYLSAIAAAGADVLYILTGNRSAASALPSDEAALLDAYRHAPQEKKQAMLLILEAKEGSGSARVQARKASGEPVIVSTGQEGSTGNLAHVLAEKFRGLSKIAGYELTDEEMQGFVSAALEDTQPGEEASSAGEHDTRQSNG